jgi:hypothetical protein
MSPPLELSAKNAKGKEMSEGAQKVECPVCGIEAHLDIRNQTMQSFMIGEDELRRRCKHLEQARKNLLCPSLQPVLTSLANSMLPSGSKP